MADVDNDESPEIFKKLRNDEAYMRTLNKSQIVSLTRRIEFEYNKHRQKKRRPYLPQGWQELDPINNFDEIQHYKCTSVKRLHQCAYADGRHKLIPNVSNYGQVKLELVQPSTGVTYFDDMGEDDYSYIESVALLNLDTIITKKHAKPIRKPRKPKLCPNNAESTIFDLDLLHINRLDSERTGKSVDLPILVHELLQFSDEMAETNGIFRKSVAMHTTTDLKSEIVKVYEAKTHNLQSSVSSILRKPSYNSPTIHASMLKNFIQGLPEALLLPGYKKIFSVITDTEDLVDKLQILNLLFLILPRDNQHFLAAVLGLFKKISSNSDRNQMTARNLAIVFQPNLFQIQTCQKKTEKMEELQINLQALIDITELLIEYENIITAVPPSFLLQLRRYRGGSDPNKKVLGLFRRPDKPNQPFLSSKLRSTLPTIMQNVAEEDMTIVVTIMEEVESERCEKITYNQDTTVQDVINGLNFMTRKDAILYESGGNLKNKRRLRRETKLHCIILENPKIQFFLTATKN